MTKPIDNLFPGARQAREQRICPTCGKNIEVGYIFRDQLSVQEFAISGLCQECQDGFFDGED